MRIPKSWVPSMAEHIVENLIKKELIEEPDVPVNTLIEETEKLLLDELMVEDRLNEEVRQFLRKYESDIEKGRLDYRKLFDMTKQKLVRERNIVL
ncbi:MAG: DUF507 family protein [Nitrospirae bacterium]|nr:DUF507 family protein [Nitrospirota bacterium]